MSGPPCPERSTVTLAATPSWTAASATAGGVAVSLPGTVLSAAANATDIGYAAPVLVSGTLLRDAGGSLSPVSSGHGERPEHLGHRHADHAGQRDGGGQRHWKATVTPRASGVLSARFAGTAGQPVAEATVGSLTVGAWTPAVTLAAQTGQQLAGAANRLTGTLSRSYAGATTAAPGVPIRIYLQTTTGASVLLATTSTTTTGTFAVTAAPTENGTLTAKVASVAGYADAASAGVPIAVTTKVGLSAPTYVGGRPRRSR